MRGARGGVAALVWAPHEERTAQFADVLDARLHTVHYLLYKRPWIAPVKYMAQALRTWQLLARDRPELVLVANPPVFAALCVALYGRLTDTPFAMDTHPPALYSRKWGWSVPLQRAVARRAAVNIVDQERFRALFAGWGAKAVVVEHPLWPGRRSTPSPPPPDERFGVLVVNTFAADEPLEPVLDAALRRPDVTFAITGDLGLAPSGAVGNAPTNVEWTGYLSGEEYWRRLERARAVVVLTTYPYSLLGGAHDGVNVGRPLVLSDQPALREHFTSGTVFVDNTGAGIALGVDRAREAEVRLRREVTELAERHRRGYDARLAALLAQLRAAGVRVV